MLCKNKITKHWNTNHLCVKYVHVKYMLVQNYTDLILTLFLRWNCISGQQRRVDPWFQGQLGGQRLIGRAMCVFEKGFMTHLVVRIWMTGCYCFVSSSCTYHMNYRNSWYFRTFLASWAKSGQAAWRWHITSTVHHKSPSIKVFIYPKYPK